MILVPSPAIKLLMRLEGMLVGGSSGTALAGALAWLRSENGREISQTPGKNVHHASRRVRPASFSASRGGVAACEGCERAAGRAAASERASSDGGVHVIKVVRARARACVRAANVRLL